MWEFPVDNKFATKLVEAAGSVAMLPRDVTCQTNLCAKCQKLEFWQPYFSITDTWEDLEAGLRTCDFCRTRWELCNHLDRGQFPTVRFDRDQSMLKLNEGYPPVLSICRDPGNQTTRTNHIQIGFPQLPETASHTHFEVLRQWLEHCGTNHPQCQPPEDGPLPTRLLHLGPKNSNTVTLYETQPADSLRYVALSHPWGKGPHFCTLLANVDQYKHNIDFKELPATFQHAVTTTRELGLEYLWIDSICIIQGDGGDFDKEAERMEDVFSSAFCVLAASSARGQDDGFLNERKQERQSLAFERSGLPTLYVCRFMDDFNQDVLEAPLSKRGWVLQERALARRTIYFTDRQTYWECGEGVRCETLTKMDNKLASFLGDPNFPSKLSSDAATSRGEKIRLYEDLYRQYTRLAFTRISDRPIAIAGLEKRLIRDLQAEGGFGVFDDGSSLLQRSLLWQRGREVRSLTRITSGRGGLSMPTWSWMAYDGGIDFLDLPLGGVHWFPDAVRSPWAAAGGAGSSSTWHTGDGRESVELRALARSFQMGAVGSVAQEEFMMLYDVPNPRMTEGEVLKCVVVGREKNNKNKSADDEMTHYVLLISVAKGSFTAKEGTKIYERVGVGYMTGKYIDLESPVQVAKIR